MSAVRTTQKHFISPGQQLGRGTVLEEIRIPRGSSSVRGCRLLCTCGTIYEAHLYPVLAGRIQSCGCLRSEESRRKQLIATAARIRHGVGSHPLYDAWRGMMSRCYDEGHVSFSNYGARGITVCDDWHDVRRFIEDIERLLGVRPAGTTLDRLNNDDDYRVGNVRWATPKQQAQNRRAPSGRQPWPDEPGALVAGWGRSATGGYCGVLRRKPRSGGRPETNRWRCEHHHEITGAAVACANTEAGQRNPGYVRALLAEETSS